METPSRARLLSAVFLISGTCVGAGMLGVPVLTGQAGLIPCLIINFFCWIFMLLTGLFFSEAILWSKEGENLLSIAKRLLGPWGKWIGGITFLYLYYSLLVAYFSGGSSILQEALFKTLAWKFSSIEAIFIFAALFGSIIMIGMRWTNRLNFILFLGAIITFFLLVFVGLEKINPELIFESNWKAVLIATPILFTTYGYHNVLPSVASYTKRNKQVLYWGVILGTLIPFVFYSIWQILVISTIPLEEIQKAASEGSMITLALIKVTQNPLVAWLSLGFSFFALVTSFLGVALSMVDFVGDGLNVKKRQGMPRVFLGLIVLIPPLFISLINPSIFIDSLSFAGGFGEATLNGILPILMVWSGLKKGLTPAFGTTQKSFLLPMLGLTVIIICVQLAYFANWI